MRSLVLLCFISAAGAGELENARNAQDRAALDKLAIRAAVAAQKQPNDAAVQYQAALAQSYVAEVAIELRDKNQAHAAAEAGIEAAKRAIALKDSAENHRVYGTLCGQAISANVMQGLKYGRCAKEEVDKAVQLDPKAAINYVARGIGYYYLPPALGGGNELAIKDFEKAIALDAKLADGHLWLGLALRKANKNAEARKEFQKALDLNPSRVWVKQQLEKTPAG